MNHPLALVNYSHRNGEFKQPVIKGRYLIERVSETDDRRWVIGFCIGDGAWHLKLGQYFARFYGPLEG